MSRYLINLNSRIYHDRRFTNERCNLDDRSHIAGMLVKSWLETEDLSLEDIRTYRYCRHCAAQERYERGAVQTIPEDKRSLLGGVNDE